MLDSKTIKKVESILKFKEDINKKEEKLQMIDFCNNLLLSKNKMIMPNVAAALYIVASEHEPIIQECLKQFDNNIDKVLYYFYILLNPVSKCITHDINHDERKHVCYMDSPAKLYFDMRFDAYKTFIDNYKSLDMNPNPITYHEKYEYIKLTDYMRYMVDTDPIYKDNPNLKELSINVAKYIESLS